jgi:hypothetical protein
VDVAQSAYQSAKSASKIFNVAKVIYRTKTDGVSVGVAKSSARILGMMSMKAAKKANPYIMAFHVGYGAYNAYNQYQETGDIFDSGVQFVTDVVFRRSSDLNSTDQVSTSSVLDSDPLALNMEFVLDSSESADYDEAIRRIKEETTLGPRYPIIPCTLQLDHDYLVFRTFFQTLSFVHP